MESDLKDLHVLIKKDFDLVDKDALAFSNIHKLRDWLAHEIQLLMDRDFHQFVNMLYRIDIEEQKTREAFASDDPPRSLANLIIERELQKVDTRKRYRN